LGSLQDCGRSAAGSAVAAAITGRLSPVDHTVDDRRGTADSGIDHECIKFTIDDTGAAFHAEIFVNDTGLFVSHLKHRMGTDLETLFTACTFLFVHLQCGDLG
jgi:hypothetical protein